MAVLHFPGFQHFWSLLKALLDLKAPLESPELTGDPTAPTQEPHDNSTKVATTEYVDNAVAELVNSSPAALDTLKELSDAIGGDANFSTTMTNALALKAPLASPALTGSPTAPTQNAGDNSTKIATTAYADRNDATCVHLAGAETVSGAKTFTAYPVLHGTGPVFGLSASEYVKGTNPATQRWGGVHFIDKTKDTATTKRAGCLEFTVATNGQTEAWLRAYNWVSGSSARGDLGIIYPKDGTPYTQAPTPAAGDNSTKIATTAFVTTAVANEDATCVHTTGNETIAGTKTFSATITGSVSGNAGTATKIQTAPDGTSFVTAAQAGKSLVNSTTTSFGSVFNAPTKSYRVALATYPSNDDYVYLYSVTNANISSGTNTKAKTLSWNASNGTLTADSFSGPLVGNVTGNCSGNAASATKLAPQGGAALPTANLGVDGLQMVEVYNNSYPTNYGNVINVQGSAHKGAGQLLLGWSGTNNGIANIYYRNKRDAATTWSDWKTVAFTDSNITGSSGSCTGNAKTATTLATARDINISDADGTNTGTKISFNGSANGTIKLPATIKASITGNCSGSSGSCTGNAATATKTTATIAVDKTGELVHATMGSNDVFRIAVGGGSNAGWAEIATGDDYNEPIYVRQYQGSFATLKRTATLLDGSGNTSFPGTVTANAFSGPLTGNVTGNCSGSSGSCTGNAKTATTLATARDINISDSDGTNTGTKISFNGSANGTIKLPATIKASITGNCSGSSGSCTGNAKTATTLATARKINGVSFNGSADITIADSTKLPLAGGTMTGNIVLDNAKIIQEKVTSMTRATAPSANVYYWPLQFVDNAGKVAGGMYYEYHTDKQAQTLLMCYRGTTNDNTWNSLRVGYDKNGNWFTYAPTPAAADDSTKIATTAWCRDATGDFACRAASAKTLSIPASGLKKGTKPTSTYWNTSWIRMDSAGTANANRLCELRSFVDTNGKSGYEMLAYDFKSGSSAAAILGIYKEMDGAAYGTAPTPATGDNSTKIATTAFVNTKCGNYLPLSGGTMTGQIKMTRGNASAGGGIRLEGAGQNYAISIMDTNVTKGTDPGSSHYMGMDFYGKTNSSYKNRIGLLQCTYAKGNVSEVGIYAYNCTSAEGTGTCAITCKVDGSGNSITYAPTPADSSNTTNIATTAWVRKFVGTTWAPTNIAPKYASGTEVDAGGGYTTPTAGVVSAWVTTGWWFEAGEVTVGAYTHRLGVRNGSEQAQFFLPVAKGVYVKNAGGMDGVRFYPV